MMQEVGVDTLYNQAPQVPGQTPGQGQVPGQTPNKNDTPASDSDDFTHIYQTGNFGTHIGKINIARGKRWVIAHGVLSSLMIIFTIASAVMMKHYLKAAFKSPLLAISWLASIFDALSVMASAYFMWRLSTLKHPLTTLMVIRTFGTLSLVMNCFFFLIALFSSIMKKEDFIGLSEKEINFFKAMYAIIAILMIFKIFSSFSFVFQWWSFCQSFPACCSCFAPYCIYEEGEELAPGVSNSLGTQKIIQFGQAASAVAQEINRM